MDSHQKSWGSTPKITEEHPDDKLRSPNSVSSSSSSISGEFSFALTMQQNTLLSTNQSPVDLSPADDIFFYGHLLPLHLFPHLPISPRSSTNSLDSFTLPGTEFMQQNQSPFTEMAEPIRLPKVKSLPFFKRWKRCSQLGKSEEAEKKRSQRKFRFELSRLLKRYARLVRPLLMFSEGRRRNEKSSNQFKPQPISFSGDLSFRAKQEMRGRKGDYSSAPASIRTSPVHGRILFSRVPSPVADSTMEELHSAIQAAIAHCKNSIASDGHCNL